MAEQNSAPQELGTVKPALGGLAETKCDSAAGCSPSSQPVIIASPVITTTAGPQKARSQCINSVRVHYRGPAGPAGERKARHQRCIRTQCQLRAGPRQPPQSTEPQYSSAFLPSRLNPLLASLTHARPAGGKTAVWLFKGRKWSQERAEVRWVSRKWVKGGGVWPCLLRCYGGAWSYWRHRVGPRGRRRGRRGLSQCVALVTFLISSFRPGEGPAGTPAGAWWRQTGRSRPAEEGNGGAWEEQGYDQGQSREVGDRWVLA